MVAGYDTPFKATDKQKRCIRAIAHGALDMTDGDLHAMIYQMIGAERVRDLTLGQAKAIIDRLKEMAGQENNTACPGKPTPRQLELIALLTRELGWDGERQRKFLEARFQVSHIRFLDDRRAWKVIEAMKAMVKGGRGERRLTNLDRDTTMVT